MNFLKILGGIGAGLLAGAGLIVAGRTGLGKPDEKADDEGKTPDAGAPETIEAEEVQSNPAEDENAAEG